MSLKQTHTIFNHQHIVESSDEIPCITDKVLLSTEKCSPDEIKEAKASVPAPAPVPVPILSVPSMNSQNELLMQNLMSFYAKSENMDIMIKIINGESNISLRIIDWFATNYAKKHFTVYDVKDGKRFKVYIDYKLKLKAYSKKRFDPFCRWDRISIPYKEKTLVQTTLGQLNFFKWAIENQVIKYIEENYTNIERDMNSRNSTAKNISSTSSSSSTSKNKTRKKREELSISASRSIKKENVQITVTFD